MKILLSLFIHFHYCVITYCSILKVAIPKVCFLPFPFFFRNELRFLSRFYVSRKLTSAKKGSVIPSLYATKLCCSVLTIFIVFRASFLHELISIFVVLWKNTMHRLSTKFRTFKNIIRIFGYDSLTIYSFTSFFMLQLWHLTNLKVLCESSYP